MKENNDSLEEEGKNDNDAQPAPDVYGGNGNNSQPAPCVPQDKKHRECIAAILSLENLFPAPLATKDEFEVIKMHAGNEDRNYARIFFEFKDDCGKKDISNAKAKLSELMRGDKNIDAILQDNPDDGNVLNNIKKIVVDRSKIEGYSQGKANDEIIFNEDNKLISVYFVKKPAKDQIKEVEGLLGNAVYNKVMVLKYSNKYRGLQEFIVDMDNNLIITNDNLKLYWHSKDNNAGGNGFDDKETPVYISSSTDVTMYNHFRINNAIKFNNVKDDDVKDDDAFYQKAMKQLGDNRFHYGINYIYNENQRILEGLTEPIGVARTWAKSVSDFMTSQVEQFNKIIKEKLNTEDKKRKIQTFCDSFKDYLLGHKKIDDGADKKDNKKYDNIIMVSNKDYNSVDAVLSWCKNHNYKDKQEQMNEIIYPVFQQITDFIKQIKEEVQNIEKSETKQNFNNIDNEEGENNNELKNSTTQPFPTNYNDVKIKMEADEQKTTCGCNCDFGLQRLKRFLGK
ncbi:MAG: hypothetical protein IJT15_02800 [Rickettsiales bacterium]|nr:hypothetical protein [Rickettsiales bacterium]